VIVNALKVDHTTGDETYKIDVVTNNGVVVGTAKVVGVGQYVILVDGGHAAPQRSDRDLDQADGNSGRHHADPELRSLARRIRERFLSDSL
jgi:hypothetical protein